MKQIDKMLDYSTRSSERAQENEAQICTSWTLQQLEHIDEDQPPVLLAPFP